MRKFAIVVLVVGGLIGLYVVFVSPTGLDGFRLMAYSGQRSPRNHELSTTHKDDQTPFQLDLAQPWRLEFGRGCGWHGLDTVKLDESGNAVFHRITENGGSESASKRLSPEVMAKVVEAIRANRLMELNRSYHAGVIDGAQWILWIRQGDRQKSVYFDNHFPEPIIRFAERLDALMVEATSPALEWRSVRGVSSRDHAKELWESIKR